MSGIRRRALLFGLLLVFGCAFQLDQLPFYLPWAAVGTVLAVRRPSNVIGLLLIAAGWAYGLASRPIDEPLSKVLGGTGSAVDFALLWVSVVAGILAFTVLFTITVTFPSGRLPGGRWGVASRLAIGFGLVVAAVSFLPSSIAVTASDNTTYLVPNPLGGFDAMTTILAAFGGVFYLAMAGTMVAGVVSMAVRLRRASGPERLQLRWVVAAFAVLVGAVLLAFSSLILSTIGIDYDSDLLWIPFLLAYPLPALAIGIAVLRYRLYEIDRIVSRTISWAVITVLLAGVLVGGIALIQAALAPFTNENSIAVAASTLLVFALFQPLRRRVQRAVDRRFDRARYDGQQTVGTFAEHVRSSVDLATLSAMLASTAGEAVRPAGSAVWLSPRRTR